MMSIFLYQQVVGYMDRKSARIKELENTAKKIHMIHILQYTTRGTSLASPRVKSLPATRETWVWYLGLEDPLEAGMATHSSILPWRMPWMEEPGGLQSMGSQMSNMQLST